MGKLVRDKVPEIIEASGREPIYRILSTSEYREELYTKLKEEIDELCTNRNSEEFADVLEVLKALYHSDPTRYDEVFIKHTRKDKERGSFYRKVYLEGIK